MLGLKICRGGAMCITHPTGRNGVNTTDDVKTIQLMLNMNLHTITPFKQLIVDGKIGDKTISAVEEFQRRVVRSVNTDGKILPNDVTICKLKEGLPNGFTETKLSAIMIHSSSNSSRKYYNALNVKMLESGISTPIRMAHFLAQLAHESGELRYSEEIASGDAYEGRADLGNSEPGDGRRFKGRGLIQLTGRSNYEAYGKTRGKDYTASNKTDLLANDPFIAVDVSCWYWVENDLNILADKDDIRAVTKAINGGYNGLEDRKSKLERAKFFLMR
jgi:putative chitinase